MSRPARVWIASTFFGRRGSRDLGRSPGRCLTGHRRFGLDQADIDGLHLRRRRRRPQEEYGREKQDMKAGGQGQRAEKFRLHGLYMIQDCHVLSSVKKGRRQYFAKVFDKRAVSLYRNRS